MTKLTNKTWMAVLAIITLTIVAWAQNPLHDRVNFTIDTPFKLKVGGYAFPPGKYILYQEIQTDPGLFQLYPDNLTNTPIATFHTVRVEYRTGEYPDEARVRFKGTSTGTVRAVTVDAKEMSVVLNIDKWTYDGIPLLRGWDIPGKDGWKIISVEAADEYKIAKG